MPIRFQDDPSDFTNNAAFVKYRPQDFQDPTAGFEMPAPAPPPGVSDPTTTFNAWTKKRKNQEQDDTWSPAPATSPAPSGPPTPVPTFDAPWEKTPFVEPATASTTTTTTPTTYAPMVGFETSKLQNPAHQTLKYQFARIVQDLGLTGAAARGHLDLVVAELRKLGYNVTAVGDDSLDFHDGNGPADDITVENQY